MSLEWETVELKSIADVTMGQSPKSDFYNENYEEIKHLEINILHLNYTQLLSKKWLKKIVY